LITITSRGGSGIFSMGGGIIIIFNKLSIICFGTTINEDWDQALEIKCRIEIGREVFRKMSKVFKCHDFILFYLSFATKIRLLKCYVFSVLLYGVET
jgi:hypothetical protein